MNDKDWIDQYESVIRNDATQSYERFILDLSEGIIVSHAS